MTKLYEARCGLTLRERLKASGTCQGGGPIRGRKHGGGENTQQLQALTIE